MTGAHHWRCGEDGGILQVSAQVCGMCLNLEANSVGVTIFGSDHSKGDPVKQTGQIVDVSLLTQPLPAVTPDTIPNQKRWEDGTNKTKKLYCV
ncbi:hypothetical protein MJO29_004455 [Puccinia striiformis f. sp. tritici]|nr:hypothetical protein MJO29_004455 [Puccinia striiformis f. sp. tritici]